MRGGFREAGTRSGPNPAAGLRALATEDRQARATLRQTKYKEVQKMS
jgi:hypothetical protein